MPRPGNPVLACGRAQEELMFNTLFVYLLWAHLGTITDGEEDSPVEAKAGGMIIVGG